MQKKSVNQRPIPTDKELFLENPKNCDILYMYLQHISQRNPDESHRYINRDNCTLKDLAKKVNLSLTTLKRRLNDLEKDGYIKRENDYIILPEPNRYFLFPQETLEFMFNNGLHMEPNLFKILSWIGDRNKIFPDKVYMTQNLLLGEVLNISTTSGASRRKIQHNIQLLIKLGFFKIDIETTRNKNRVMRVYDFTTTIKLDEKVKEYYKK